MALTPEQKARYVREPAGCPYCGSAGIEAGERDYDDAWLSQEVTCRDCKREWEEVYTLTDIQERGA